MYIPCRAALENRLLPHTNMVMFLFRANSRMVHVILKDCLEQRSMMDDRYLTGNNSNLPAQRFVVLIAMLVSKDNTIVPKKL
jgi:hypothetical protein